MPKINKKTGQIVKDTAPAGLAEKLGATETFEPKPVVKTFSRPEGTAKSLNVETTGMTPKKQEEIQLANAVVGQQLKAEKQGVDVAEILANARTAELANQSTKGQDVPMADIEQMSAEAKPTPTAFEAAVSEQKDILGGMPTNTFGENLQAQAQSVGSAAIGGVRTTIQILDNVRALTSLGGKDTIRVKDARTLFTMNNGLIANEIKNVKLGGDPSVALDALRRSITANNVLHSDAHRKGLDNLRYWLGGGADVEEEALINDEQLKNLADDLNEAIIISRTRGKIVV